MVFEFVIEFVECCDFGRVYECEVFWLKEYYLLFVWVFVIGDSGEVVVGLFGVDFG